jgi:acetoacetyl-CoA synthetase
MAEHPEVLFTPSQAFIENANLSKYMLWLKETQGLSFSDYDGLWRWSVDHVEDFWQTIWDFFGVQYSGSYDAVLSEDFMPFSRWFEGTEVNYAEHIFRNATDRYPALISKSEHRETRETSWKELEIQVAAFKCFLEMKGVEKGDRVVAYMPNIPEANIAFLAANAIGAIWSSTSPDFGVSSVLDRFKQIEPKVLIAADGYQYNGKAFDRLEQISELASSISSIQEVVLVPFINENLRIEADNWTIWEESLNQPQTTLTFNRVPFDHPIWVLYSSGTTGIPKAITQSHGGILLEHLKYLSLHANIKPGERCFWFTTTGWMMWNYIQASWLAGGTVVLYEGSPAFPDLNELWRFTEDIKINHFGTSAGYITANMKADLKPSKQFDLSSLISIGSTGSPLPPEGFTWIYDSISEAIWLTSISGGSDVCTAFVGGVPTLPVYKGEIQARALGCSLYALDEAGNQVMGELGEMVINKPMPSMPIFFWNDPNNERYLESYFSVYPNQWRHGDWIEITSRGGVIIYGRSDSTLNRGGVRIGTSEIYRAVDGMTEYTDSMVVYYEKDNEEHMPLFVVMAKDTKLNAELIAKTKRTIREQYTPRHVPDEIIAIVEIPYTISGKKMETPVKKILMGEDVSKIMNKDAMKNPQALDYFLQ